MTDYKRKLLRSRLFIMRNTSGMGFSPAIKFATPIIIKASGNAFAKFLTAMIITLRENVIM